MQSIEEQICNYMRLLYERRLTTAFGGNISVRKGDSILITPSGIPKWEIKPEDIVEMDLRGNIIRGKNPSSEWRTHLKIYENKDAGAVVHAHCPVTTALATIGIPYKVISYEAIDLISNIEIMPYIKFGTQEFADAVGNLVRKADIIVVKNHGLITTGKNLKEAFFRLEAVEHNSIMLLISSLLSR
ncbi:MAG: class II aldolase/adducin family protein [Candidatus Methanodesulfokora sp.]|jgi:L-fuculose-phosphate aldolase